MYLSFFTDQNVKGYTFFFYKSDCIVFLLLDNFINKTQYYGEKILTIKLCIKQLKITKEVKKKKM